jgi:hypothetical protein
VLRCSAAKYSHLGQIPDLQLRGVTVAPLGSVVRAPGAAWLRSTPVPRAQLYRRRRAGSLSHGRGEGTKALRRSNARVAQLRANPTEEMMQRARTTATDLTLMGQSGKFMRRIQGWTTGKPIFPAWATQPLKFIDPFVHIAGQIVKRSVGEQTPLGLLSSRSAPT